MPELNSQFDTAGAGSDILENLLLFMNITEKDTKISLDQKLNAMAVQAMKAKKLLPAIKKQVCIAAGISDRGLPVLRSRKPKGILSLKAYKKSDANLSLYNNKMRKNSQGLTMELAGNLPSIGASPIKEEEPKERKMIIEGS